MKCGDVYRSVAAWQKLANINIKPKLALKILRYTKKVSEEYNLIEKQRIALVHELTGTKAGEEARIEPDTEASKLYSGGLQEILLVGSDLQKLDIDFGDVIDAVDEKSEVLTVVDLAALEPFFGCPDDCPCAGNDDLTACPCLDSDSQPDGCAEVACPHDQ